MSTEYVTILGDFHSHITMHTNRNLKRYEVVSGNNLATIFQVGDFGAFPPQYRVDEAAMRFWVKDLLITNHHYILDNSRNERINLDIGGRVSSFSHCRYN